MIPLLHFQSHELLFAYDWTSKRSALALKVALAQGATCRLLAWPLPRPREAGVVLQWSCRRDVPKIPIIAMGSTVLSAGIPPSWFTYRASKRAFCARTPGGIYETSPPNFLWLAAGAAVPPAMSRIARAQAAYPTRPARILVGFPAGGAADTIARLMAQWLSDRLGQSFVVENRSGAATNLALQAALASPPDGYSLVYISTSTAISTTLYGSLSVNFLRDSSTVAGLVRFPHVMAAHPSLAANTVPELIALARSSLGKVNVASYGTGSTSHLAGELRRGAL
jgi:hypothetical protein